MGSFHWHSRPAYSPYRKMRLLLSICMILFVLATTCSARPNKNDESISLVKEVFNNKLRLVKRDDHDDEEEEDDDYEEDEEDFEEEDEDEEEDDEDDFGDDDYEDDDDEAEHDDDDDDDETD